jgi:hypothetical protein
MQILKLGENENERVGFKTHWRKIQGFMILDKRRRKESKMLNCNQKN